MRRIELKLKFMIPETHFENEYVLVDKDDSLIEVSRRLARQDIERIQAAGHQQISILAAYVMDGKKPIGIIVKDDIIDKCILECKDLEKTTAKDIMTSPIESVDVNDEIQDAVNLIVEKNYLSIPILEDEELKGVFTVFDAIWALNMEEANL